MNEIRYIPEWERQSAVLMVWPTPRMDWGYIIEEVESCYARLITEILRYEPVVLLCDHRSRIDQLVNSAAAKYPLICVEGIYANDTWARDFAPLSVTINGSPAIIDFGFNAWGLKFASNVDNTLTRQLYHDHRLFDSSVEYINRLDFICEGGALETDGCGTLMTTSSVLCEQNRNPAIHIDRQRRILSETLGCEQVYILDVMPMAGDDTDGHIDTLARFCNPSTIVYNYTQDETDPHYALMQSLKAEVTAMRRPTGEPYTCIPLPLPESIIDEDEGIQLPATYANFLIINGAVLVPIYGVDQDEQALSVLRDVFTDREVVGVDCRVLVRQHGSLHCITMQLPDGYIRKTEEE